MKYGPRNIELILLASLITATAVVFVVLVAGTLSKTPQTTLLNLSVLMIFGGTLQISIILLRIYDKLTEMLEIMKNKNP